MLKKDILIVEVGCVMKKWMIILCMIGLGIGLGIRIKIVNENAPQEKYEFYEKMEWVEYEGAFQIDSIENTDGYSARVLDAEVVTYREYMEKYELPMDTLIDTYFYGRDDIDKEKYYNMPVIDLEIEYNNVLSENGYIDLVEPIIFSMNDNVAYRINQSILEVQIPEVVTMSGIGFTLHPTGKSVVLHLPYTLPIYSNGELAEETGNYPKYLALTRTI